MFKNALGILMVSMILVGMANALPSLMQADAQNEAIDCSLPEGETTTIADAKLYIEYNYTDGDLGVHGNFDDHGWSELCVYNPNGELILAVKPQSQLKDLTMAGIFFESREPETDDFDFPELMTRFPEGQYTVVGTNYDGTGLTGFATFTHIAPMPPVILSPTVTEDEDEADEYTIPLDDLVVMWETVTTSVNGDPITIVGYEVIVTLEDYEDPNGFSHPIYDVHVLADQNSLTVPAEFFQPNSLYELEILALEQSGNQTIGLGFFKTE
jgi:hypothetical protein